MNQSPCPYCGDLISHWRGGPRKKCDKPQCRRAYNNERAKRYGRAYRQRHPIERKARKAYYEALARGGREIGVFTASEWGHRLAEYGGSCAYCGSGEQIEIEHVIPLCRGGSNLIANVVPACHNCNQDKGTRTPVEWLEISSWAQSLDPKRWPSGEYAISPPDSLVA